MILPLPRVSIQPESKQAKASVRQILFSLSLSLSLSLTLLLFCQFSAYYSACSSPSTLFSSLEFQCYLHWQQNIHQHHPQCAPCDSKRRLLANIFCCVRVRALCIPWVCCRFWRLWWCFNVFLAMGPHRVYHSNDIVPWCAINHKVPMSCSTKESEHLKLTVHQ